MIQQTSWSETFSFPKRGAVVSTPGEPLNVGMAKLILTAIFLLSVGCAAVCLLFSLRRQRQANEHFGSRCDDEHSAESQEEPELERR
jgi:hypothetical protein